MFHNSRIFHCLMRESPVFFCKTFDNGHKTLPLGIIFAEETNSKTRTLENECFVSLRTCFAGHFSNGEQNVSNVCMYDIGSGRYICFTIVEPFMIRGQSEMTLNSATRTCVGYCREPTERE